MPVDFGNREQIDAINQSALGNSERAFISFNEGKNYIYHYPVEQDVTRQGKIVKEWLPSAEIANVHYVDVGGQTQSFHCLGDGNIFNPKRLCPACAKAASYHEMAKQSKAKADKDKYGKLRDNLRSTFQAYLLACEGDGILVEKDGKRQLQVEFKSDVKVKILRLSFKQWLKLVGGPYYGDKVIKGLKEEYDFIQTDTDLCNRAMMYIKEKGKGKYGEVSIVPAEFSSPPPKVEGALPNLKEMIPAKDKEGMIEALNLAGDGEDDLEEIGSTQESFNPSTPAPQAKQNGTSPVPAPAQPSAQTPAQPSSNPFATPAPSQPGNPFDGAPKKRSMEDFGAPVDTSNVDDDDEIPF